MQINGQGLKRSFNFRALFVQQKLKHFFIYSFNTFYTGSIVYKVIISQRSRSEAFLAYTRLSLCCDSSNWNNVLPRRGPSWVGQCYSSQVWHTSACLVCLTIYICIRIFLYFFRIGVDLLSLFLDKPQTPKRYSYGHICFYETERSWFINDQRNPCDLLNFESRYLL